MPYRSISTDLKERALHLISEGWSIDDVVDAFGVSERSIQRWTRNVAQHDSVVAPSTALRGRPRILSARQMDTVLAMLEQRPTDYLEEILDHLATHEDVMMSRSQLRQNIVDAGFTHKLVRQRAAQQNPEAHARFKEFQAAHLRASMCVCVDESSKDNRTLYRRYGWAPSGQRPNSDVDINRGQRYSILPVLAVDGYIACRVVKCSVKGPEFFDFIVNDVVRSLDCGLHAHSLLQLPLMNPFPGDRSVLIMDNCSIHKSQVLREVVEATGAQSCALLLPVLTHAVPQVFSWCLYRRTRPSLTLSRRASML